MALNVQHHLYMLDTSSLYSDEELALDIKLNHARRVLAKVKERFKSKSDYAEETYSRHVKVLNRIIRTTKNLLKEQIAANVTKIRTVRDERLTEKAVISIFDSALTRALNMAPNQLTDEIVVVKTYYFQILESIIKNGFMMRGEKYVFHTAGSGQIRTKKFVAIKESSLKRVWGKLTCGLTPEKINELGGINTNKYLVYLALSNSATDVWEEFDIDRSIVVDDLEFPLTGEVDFINNETFEITRETRELPFTQSDGCGLIDYGTTNFIIRAPWLKGLLSSFPFRKFIKEKNGNPVIRDIYGDEHDIEAEDIQVIFTKSQFKMHKFFRNWEEYKAGYKKYGCTMGVCNREGDFLDTVVSYQMLQTLTDISDEEIQYLTKATRNKLTRLSSDVETQLKVFGAGHKNSNKNAFQESLSLYPELLRDNYTKETLKAIKNSLEKEAWSGKLDVWGKYTFIIPDLYGFCEYLFLGKERPVGLVADGEVYCSLFRSVDRVACLRSPHLFREWGLRNNVAKSKKEISEWFVTKGVYFSNHDMISRLLQNDADGDCSLVIGDKKIVEIGDRNMRGVVPLFYHMGTAKPSNINKESLYAGMTLAFTEGNIGGPSNEITKIWNSEGEIDLDAIKIQCAITNYTIDAAKTLFKPELPPVVQEKMRAHYGKKLPFFFQFAKDKLPHQVEQPANRLVDKIKIFIPKSRLNFKNKTLGKFDWRMLTSEKEVEEGEIYDQITRRWQELTKSLNQSLHKSDKKDNFSYVFGQIRDEMFLFPLNEDEIVDSLVHFLFFKRKTKFKFAFWSCFGEYVLKNIKNNMREDYVYCNRCGKRFLRRSASEHYCDKCRGQQKAEPTQLICIDCHKEFEVAPTVKGKTRCNDCQKKYRNIVKNRQKGTTVSDVR